MAIENNYDDKLFVNLIINGLIINPVYNQHKRHEKCHMIFGFKNMFFKTKEITYLEPFINQTFTFEMKKLLLSNNPMKFKFVADNQTIAAVNISTDILVNQINAQNIDPISLILKPKYSKHYNSIKLSYSINEPINCHSNKDSAICCKNNKMYKFKKNLHKKWKSVISLDVIKTKNDSFEENDQKDKNKTDTHSSSFKQYSPKLSYGRSSCSNNNSTNMSEECTFQQTPSSTDFSLSDRSSSLTLNYLIKMNDDSKLKIKKLQEEINEQKKYIDKITLLVMHNAPFLLEKL